MFHSPFINPLQDLPEADPLGLEAWAASNGLAPDIALALVASVLAGVAGPARDLGLPDSQLDNPGINLAAGFEDAMCFLVLGSGVINPPLGSGPELRRPPGLHRSSVTTPSSDKARTLAGGPLAAWTVTSSQPDRSSKEDTGDGAAHAVGQTQSNRGFFSWRLLASAGCPACSAQDVETFRII